MRVGARLGRAFWGFRGKLALSIAATFIVLGACLVAVQVAILSQSIASTIDVSIGGPVDVEAPVVLPDPASLKDTVECVTTVETSDCQVEVSDETSSYGRLVASDVMDSYITWTLVLLVVFAVVSAALSWRLTRSPARKISDVAQLAEQISERDLSQRIALTGPRDEITRLADQVDTMLARLEGAFVSQEQFVANASHELRTPITSVRAALEAPLTQGRVPPDLQPYVHRALRSVRRMDDLIAALLLIARSRHLDADQRSRVDLAMCVRDELEAIQVLAQARGLRVECSGIEESVFVEVSAGAITIAVGNILRNAVQHNRDDGWISVDLRVLGDRVVLAVGNSGPVYSTDEVTGLTEAFNRGGQTRLAGTPGTGLGLTIVESIAAAHDAVLVVQPGCVDGLVVHLTLQACSS